MKAFPRLQISPRKKADCHRSAILLVLLVCTLALTPLAAEDWPQWRGHNRRGVWAETGTLDTFPASSLNPRWTTPIAAGYSGPAVANGRVYVTDFRLADPDQNPNKGTERALCLDERTGKVLWTYEWPADYTGMDYGLGPRATPTVDGDRLYILGAVGQLFSLDAATGKLIWSRDYRNDFAAELPMWGAQTGQISLLLRQGRA
jgi:outer membrane protein assembly factor BamB